ncbi:hypothetical protein [Pseudoduganella rhizocola]|uniref:hypothetical protein n=1 Tax=Pseudoduganella rhizocola TaxID=3382643 RepID=UPI0038B627A7
MNARDTSQVVGTVRVIQRGDYQIAGNTIQLPIANALNLQTELLHEVCFSELRPLSEDLSILFAAIKCADRSIRRHHAKGWARRLSISVPVFEVNTWRTTPVHSTLINALDYLTGDAWQVKFVARSGKPLVSQSAPLLSSPERQRIFIPFSHGLDSFAQSVLLKAADEIWDIMPIHLHGRKANQNMKFARRGVERGVPPIPVSAKVSERKHAELSFRTRPFLYNGFAAYAAALSGGGTVVIPENGQGSLGASLVRLGEEAPHRSCHPGFTTRLAAFFNNLTGAEVKFVHPALFQTKGQVLSALNGLLPNSPEWLLSHTSCSYDSRQSNRGRKKVHCGVCGNCLLRRMGLHAANIEDVTPYKFQDLRATSLEDSMQESDTCKTLSAYQDVAHNGVRSMHRLADVLSPPNRYRVAGEVDSLAHYLKRPSDDVRNDYFGMLTQHRQEWTNFLSSAGKESWLARFTRG